MALLPSRGIKITCVDLLGEKSKHHSNKHDPDLLEIVNSANIACGYHAGDEATMNDVIKISRTSTWKIFLVEFRLMFWNAC